MLSNLEIMAFKIPLTAKFDSAYGLGPISNGSPRNVSHPNISKLDSMLSYYIY